MYYTMLSHVRHTTAFRSLLTAKKPLFIMEAHNGISAKIVERTGFKAIWGSGLTLSGSRGVRDSNEMSWTNLVDQLETMADSVNIPILFDGDTGFGNYNNARRLVRKLEERGIAGVCMEDKLFPKTNSFVNSESQTLADITEHANKITACKEYQRDPDFSVVARLESLIVGAGTDDALMRAEKYTAAGADAILVHSRKSNFTEIDDFCKKFKQINQQCHDIPLVVVPTKYYNTSVDTMVDSGVNNFIWANHNLRASITAMENVSRQIYEDQSLVGIEHSIATVDDIFDYQNDAQLRADDTFYMGKELVVDKRKQQELIKKMVVADVVFDRAVGPEIVSSSQKQSIDPIGMRNIFSSMGITYHVGVPDSALKEYYHADDTVVANEGIAMSVATGYAIETGKIPVVYLQNSGLGNVLNPLVSLNGVYKVPSIMLVGWRGDDQTDEVQHNTQGRLTPKVLNTHNIPYMVVDGSETHTELTTKLDKIKTIATRDKTTVCILVRPGSFAKNPSPNIPINVGTMNPDIVMDVIVRELRDTNVVTSTGFNTRRFYDATTRNPDFNIDNGVLPCPGSMGHALSIGIGASQQTDKRIVVVDGDGGFHMHSGSAANISSANNLTHVVLDNSSHESVGQQKTCATKSVDMKELLSAYPYDSVTEVNDEDELAKALSATNVGNHAIICPTHLSDTKFGRPSMKPDDIEGYIAKWRCC